MSAPIARSHRTRGQGARQPLFAMFSIVRLTAAAETDDGLPLPVGTTGTVIDVYAEGEAYEVEFTRPVGNATIEAGKLEASATGRA